MANLVTSGKWVAVGGDPSYASHFSPLGHPQLSWGSAVNKETSSYAFDGVSVQAHVGGDPFLLGTFTHHNFPIYLPFERFTVDLEVSVSVDGGPVQPFTITFEHYESPNRGPVAAQSDVVTVKDVKVERAVQVDGLACDLLITGLYVHNTNMLSHRFVSPEGGTNWADLHVQITPYSGAK
ncbi:hypothetical protein GCM10027168_05870 [Streptomyces capparidis]